MRENRFLIISEPRTGSNNISYCLDAHPELVVGNELLHPGNGIKPEAYGLPPDCAGSITDNGFQYHWIESVDENTRNTVLTGLFEQHNGFKIHTHHIPVDLVMDIVTRYDCKIILMKRLSVFDQAMSNYIAVARDRWHADEKIERTVDTEPFTVSIDHFTRWVEGLLGVRRALWARLKDMHEKVILIEYESFFSGAQEARARRMENLYHMLGLKKLGEFDQETRSASYARLEHYLSEKKQKLTDTETAKNLVGNYDEVALFYSLWLMKSYDKVAVV